MNARYEDFDEHWYCENCDEHHEGECPMRDISLAQLHELEDAGLYRERRRVPYNEEN